MLSSELNSIKSSKRSIFTIIFLFIVVILGELITWYGNYYMFWNYAKQTHRHLSYQNIYHPTMTTFLSGNTSGQFLQIIIIWLLPLYLILISAQRIIDNNRNDSNYIYTSRYTKFKQYLGVSELTQFSIFTVFFIVLFGLDFVIAELLFHNGQSFMDLEDSVKYSHLLKLELLHPNLAYISFIVVVSMSFGLFAVVVHVLALLLKKPILVHPISLDIWFFMVAMPNSSTYFIQPFIEYDWGTYFSALISYLVICSSIIAVGNFWLKLRGRYVYLN